MKKETNVQTKCPNKNCEVRELLSYYETKYNKQVATIKALEETLKDTRSFLKQCKDSAEYWRNSYSRHMGFDKPKTSETASQVTKKSHPVVRSMY